MAFEVGNRKQSSVTDRSGGCRVYFVGSYAYTFFFHIVYMVALEDRVGDGFVAFLFL